MKKSYKEWLSKPVNNVGVLTNYERRLLDRKGEKNRRYNKKYFSTEKGKKKRSENMTSFYKANPPCSFYSCCKKKNFWLYGN